MPSNDFCAAVRVTCDGLSPEGHEANISSKPNSLHNRLVMRRRTVAPQDPSSATGSEPARRSDPILPAEARRWPPLPSLVAHFGVGSRGVLDPHRRFARIQYHTCGPGERQGALKGLKVWRSP